MSSPAATASAGDAAPSDLPALLGDRFSTDAFERGFYTRDLAPVPSLLARLVGRTLPDALARPADAAEVAAVVSHAARERLAITPRAAATTAYWNAVPMRGGIVLDLNGLRGLVGVDEASLTASVLPGTRWQELDKSLEPLGLAPCSYPTSAPSATVGGWLSMQGHGVGSLRYGSLEGQVRLLQVVLADGRMAEVDRVTTPPASWFAGAEGTLGVVTRIDLAVRRRPESERALLLSLPDMASAQRVVQRLAAASPLPQYLHFADAGFQEMLGAGGFPAAKAPGILLSAVYDGTVAETAAGAVAAEKACASAGGAMMGPGDAAADWSERFTSLRLKRAGPTLLAAESWLPLDGLAGYGDGVRRLAGRQALTMATYGMAVKPGAATVMTAFPSDETRTVRYLLDLSLTAKLYGIAFRHGGRPYGTGVWNTPYLGAWLTRADLRERRARKHALDPLDIMNPGKLYGPPLLLRQPVFGWAMEALALVRRMGGRAL